MVAWLYRALGDENVAEYILEFKTSYICSIDNYQLRRASLSIAGLLSKLLGQNEVDILLDAMDGDDLFGIQDGYDRLHQLFRC